MEIESKLMFFQDWDDLEILEEIGRGNFGAVNKASYLGTTCAIKRLLKLEDADAKYIQRELEVLRNLSHPNIVQFMGLSKNEDCIYVVQEFVAKGCLSQVLYGKDPLLWSKRVRFALDCVQAMAFIHSKNLIHRDIKAENLLLDEHDKVKLCDFGFARKIEKKLEKLQNPKKMQQLTIAGTDEWMAPEVIVGMPYGKEADVFSFGVTLTEMILREKPEERHPRNAFDFEKEEFEAKVPKDCPPEFAALVIACCLYEPKDRPEARTIIKGLKSLQPIVSQKEQEQEEEKTPKEKIKTRPTSLSMSKEVIMVETQFQKSQSRDELLAGSALYEAMNPCCDENTTSGLPNENDLFRNIPVPMASLNGELIKKRKRWICYEEKSKFTIVEGYLKICFEKVKKEQKCYFVVLGDPKTETVGDILYYFKSKKSGEKNIGRIIIEKSSAFEIVPVKKNFELVVTTYLRQGEVEVFKFREKKEILENFLATLKKMQDSSSLDWNSLCQNNESREGQTYITQDEDTASFIIQLKTHPITLIICINKAGIRFVSLWLEDVLLEVTWPFIKQWQISRNDLIELTLVTGVKKPPLFVLEFSCISSHAAEVFTAFEKCSKGETAPLLFLSPRTTKDSIERSGSRKVTRRESRENEEEKMQ